MIMNKLVLLWFMILAYSANSFVLRGMLQPNDDDDDWLIDTYDDIIWTISTTGLPGKPVTTGSFGKVNNSVCKNESLSIKTFSSVNQSAAEEKNDNVTNRGSFIFKKKLNIYGNQTFLKPGYKYAYPIIIGMLINYVTVCSCVGKPVDEKFEYGSSDTINPNCHSYC